MVEHAVPLGHEHADPLRALGHFDAHQPFGGERDAELVAERAQPVVPVR